MWDGNSGRAQLGGYSPDGGWNLNYRGLARQPSIYCLGAGFLTTYLVAVGFKGEYYSEK